MDLMTILYWAYVVIAVVAIWLTIRERMRERQQNLGSALLGLLACLLWPLMTAFMAVAVVVEARSARGERSR